MSFALSSPRRKRKKKKATYKTIEKFLDEIRELCGKLDGPSGELTAYQLGLLTNLVAHSYGNVKVLTAIMVEDARRCQAEQEQQSASAGTAADENNNNNTKNSKKVKKGKGKGKGKGKETTGTTTTTTTTTTAAEPTLAAGASSSRASP